MGELGYGLCCCKFPLLVVQRGAASPFQFYRKNDRVFYSGMVHRAVDLDVDLIDPTKTYHHVGEWDGVNFSMTRFIDGVIDQVIEVQNLANSPPAIGWGNFVECVFGPTDPLQRISDKNSDESAVYYLQRGASDLNGRRAFDLGESLYDVPEGHGESHLYPAFNPPNNPDQGSYGVRNGKLYKFQRVPLTEWSPIGQIRAPLIDEVRTVKISLKTSATDEGYDPCIADFDADTNESFGVSDRFVGMPGLRVDNHHVRFGCIPFRFAAGDIRWRVEAGTYLATSGGFTQAAAGDLLEVEFSFDGAGTLTILPSVNGVLQQYQLDIPANPPPFTKTEVYVDNVNSSMIYSMLAGYQAASSPAPGGWVMSYADSLTAETTGVGPDGDQWAGFDVEYDNIQDITTILLNGQWTFRTGRTVALRPTSWGMQWPINYTATGLPPGLSIDPKGISGTPTGGTNGTANITATDDNGVVRASSYNWQVV